MDIWLGVLTPAVSQQPSRHGARGLSFFESDFAIHHDPVVTFRFLDSAPLATRQVLGNLRRQNLQFVEVVYDDVSGGTFLDRSPVFEPAKVGREVR